MSHAPTPAAVALPVISALSSMIQYLEDELKQILKTILNFSPFASFLAFAPAL